MRLLGSLCALVAFAVVPSLGGPALRPPRLALRAPYPPLARARCGARMGAGGTSGAERSARKGARGGGGVTPATQPASSQAPMRELFTPGFEAPLGGQVDTRTLNAALNFAGLAVVVLAVVVKLLTVDAEISRGWTWFEIVSRLPSDNWSDYTSFLTASPVLTKAITSGTVYALGDILAQSTEGKGLADLDRVRTVRSSLCGFTLHGPLSHLWYIFAERLFDLLHWGAWYFVPLKILTDQLTWGALWNALYIAAIGLTSGRALPTIQGEIKETVFPLIRDGLKLWCPAHMITYGVVPIENRLLWVDLVEILWVVILSTTASASKQARESNGVA